MIVLPSNASSWSLLCTPLCLTKQNGLHDTCTEVNCGAVLTRCLSVLAAHAMLAAALPGCGTGATATNSDPCR